MPPTFGWDNLEDIAIGLADKFPDTDPLTVRFTDMHKWITELPGFSGDPSTSNEANLQPIQLALHEECQYRHGYRSHKNNQCASHIFTPIISATHLRTTRPSLCAKPLKIRLTP